MRVSVEISGTLERKMSVSVPAEQVENEVSTRLSKLTRSAKLPGFRPGKVPIKIIEAKFGGQVLNEVAGELIQTSLRDAFQQESLNPAGGPSIEPKSIARGQDLEYVAVFEVFPEIPDIDIKDQKIDVPLIEITDEDIEHTLENVRKQRIEWIKTDATSSTEDQVVINYQGSVDGEVFQGGEGEDFPVVLGSGAVLKDLDDALHNRKPGDKFETDVNFPEEYGNDELAGKVAVFSVEVVSVSNPQLPEMDAEFAKTFGIDDGDLGKLQADVRNNLERELKERIAETVRQNVLKKLLENIDFDIPTPLVENEINSMIETQRQQMERQGLPQNPDDLDRTLLTEEARRRVKLGLMLHHVIDTEGITADADEVRSRIENIASTYEQPEAFVKWYYEDKSRVAQVESVVLEQQVVDKLLENADQVENPSSFEEFMNPSLPSTNTDDTEETENA